MDPIFVSCPLGGLVAEFDNYVLLAKGWPSHEMHDIIIDRVRRSADMQRLREEYAAASDELDACTWRYGRSAKPTHAAAMEARAVKRAMQGLYKDAINRHVAATARSMPMAEYRARVAANLAAWRASAAAWREEMSRQRLEAERKEKEWREEMRRARGEHVPDTTPDW